MYSTYVKPLNCTHYTPWYGSLKVPFSRWRLTDILMLTYLDLKLNKNHQKWILYTWKTIKRRLIHHSKVIGPNFPDGFWQASWIYIDYESCPKLWSWQQSWICSRTPLDYESPTMFIGKNFSRFRKCQIDYESTINLILALWGNTSNMAAVTASRKNVTLGCKRYIVIYSNTVVVYIFAISDFGVFDKGGNK